MSDSQIPTTRLESVDHIRDATKKPQRTPTGKELTVTSSDNQGVAKYRPSQRPPMALVCVQDDGRNDGDWVRVHADTFVIGRSEGDLILPHEIGMSGRHMELHRTVKDGRFRWCLKDLKSTNGTFARIQDALLHHRQELMIGAHRYRFYAAPENPAARIAQSEGGSAQRAMTQQWRTLPAESVEENSSALIEVTPEGDGDRYSLSDEENWIGSDEKQCAICINNDPYVDGRHAKLFKDGHGRWRIEDAGSLNGTWVRIEEILIESDGGFQAGEQRFFIKIL